MGNILTSLMIIIILLVVTVTNTEFNIQNEFRVVFISYYKHKMLLAGLLLGFFKTLRSEGTSGTSSPTIRL